MIPDIVRLPSPAALVAANESLSAEITAHRETLASLDRHVRERTGELEKATAALAVQAREAVHRSGNLLAVVHSLAKQSARGARYTDQFLASFLGRVQALADTTRSIAKSDRSSADIMQVVDAGLEVLRGTYGGRIVSGGPTLTIDPVAAQQLSLALYELSTNTQKYGLGASDGAEVDVRWTVDAEMFEFVWRERGIDLTALEGLTPTEGFDSKLLMRIVPRMLDGEAERTFQVGEMVYRLSAPITAVASHKTDEFRDLLAARIIDTSFGLD